MAGYLKLYVEGVAKIFKQNEGKPANKPCSVTGCRRSEKTQNYSALTTVQNFLFHCFKDPHSVNRVVLNYLIND